MRRCRPYGQKIALQRTGATYEHRRCRYNTYTREGRAHRLKRPGVYNTAKAVIFFIIPRGTNTVARSASSSPFFLYLISFIFYLFLFFYLLLFILRRVSPRVALSFFLSISLITPSATYFSVPSFFFFFFSYYLLLCAHSLVYLCSFFFLCFPPPPPSLIRTRTMRQTAMAH